jgi:hypothetical protein
MWVLIAYHSCLSCCLLRPCTIQHTCRKDRIEAARREMHQRTAGGRLEDISLEELLGEGTFGKVYKGGPQGLPPGVEVGGRRRELSTHGV